MPYLRTLSSFRDGVRKVAIAKGDHALKDILALSDKLRDVDLVPLGVALDDQEGNRYSFFMPRDSRLTCGFQMEGP
jgi:cysteinyl-tRNA synthetase